MKHTAYSVVVNFYGNSVECQAITYAMRFQRKAIYLQDLHFMNKIIEEF